MSKINESVDEKIDGISQGEDEIFDDICQVCDLFSNRLYDCKIHTRNFEEVFEWRICAHCLHEYYYGDE